MSSFQCLNFYDLCRVCTASSTGSVNIFSVEGRNKNLSVKLAECLSLTVDEKDHLPKVVCAQCVSQIETMMEFRNSCQNSQTLLQSMLTNKTTAQQPPIRSNTNNNGGNLLSSIMQAVAIQPDAIQNVGGNDNKSFVQQYTITVDSCGNLKTEPVAATAQTFTALQQNQSPSQLSTATQAEKTILRNSNLEEFLKMKPNLKVTPLGKKDNNKQKPAQQPIQQQMQQQQEQVQLQQQSQPQLQQQQQQPQQQEQLQPHFTSLQLQQLQQLLQQQQIQQLQQQIATQLQPQQICFTTSAPNDSNLHSPSKSKKAKLNFVFTSSATAGGSVGTTQQPQIQLQLQPNATQQQQSSSAAAAALLSNLAPLLQTQAVVAPQHTSGGMLSSPGKCYLPITIKDEHSDQQILAHIDTKSLLLPTATYQLEMKLQPQLSTTADGQPIVQLTPTAIPATLQLTPQSLAGGQIVPAQTHMQQQQPSSSVQITSQQIIRSVPISTTGTIANVGNSTNDAATSTSTDQTDANDSHLRQQKYTISQQPGSNTIEITPTTNFTQQIMQQVKQQQKQKLQQQQIRQRQLQKLKLQQQSQAQQSPQQQPLPKPQQQKSQTATSKHGITVQRITTTATSTATMSVKMSPRKPQQAASPTVPKLPIINKQNMTISRIVPQQQQTKVKSAQQIATISVQKQEEQLVKKPTTATVTATTTTAKKVVSKLGKIVVSAVANEQHQLHEQENAIVAVPSTDGTNNASASNILDCSQCGRTFKKKEHLTQHAKLHAGIRPFKCSEANCAKTFSRKEHLLRHQISHTGRKMFSCDVCQKLFSRKDNLNKHRRIHNGQPNTSNYACDVCGKTFAVRNYYQQHKRQHESGNKDVQPLTDAAGTAAKLETVADRAKQHQQLDQVQIVQQHAGQQSQSQPQIMRLQLPGNVVTTQDLAGNTITITQSNDQQAGKSTLTVGGHDGLLSATTLASFVQLGQGQAQFVDATTGQIVGHIKIEK